MDEKHRTVLRHHRSDLRKDLDPKKLFPDMVNVFDESDEQEIKAQVTREEQVDKMLEILPRRGPQAFKSFVRALGSTQRFLADQLIEETADEDIKNLLKQERSHSVDLQKRIDAREKEILVLQKKLRTQAAEPSNEDLLLKHLASLDQFTNKLLLKQYITQKNITEAIHNSGEHNQDCSVCREFQQYVGKTLKGDVKDFLLQDAHRINKYLVVVKKMLEKKDQIVADTLKEKEKYVKGHALKKEKKALQERNKEMSLKAKEEKVKQEASEEKRKLRVQRDELQQLNNQLKEDNQKYEKLLLNARKEISSAKGEEYRLRCEMEELRAKLKELSDKYKMLTDERSRLKEEVEITKIEILITKKAKGKELRHRGTQTERCAIGSPSKERVQNRQRPMLMTRNQREIVTVNEENTRPMVQTKVFAFDVREEERRGNVHQVMTPRNLRELLRAQHQNRDIREGGIINDYSVARRIRMEGERARAYNRNGKRFELKFTGQSTEMEKCKDMFTLCRSVGISLTFGR